MGFHLSASSRARLAGVHPDLVRVVERAAAIAPPGVVFIVTEGLRDRKRQAELLAAGASQTMNSRHLTGHAVDLAALVEGQVRWDWPLYHRLGNLMKEAAAIERVPIEWGGDWRSFKDGPHFQLPWKHYPLPPQKTASQAVSSPPAASPPATAPRASDAPPRASLRVSVEPEIKPGHRSKVSTWFEGLMVRLGFRF